MPEKKQEIASNSSELKSNLIKAVVAVIILGGILLFDILTPYGGNVHFYREWMRCGQRPYESHVLPGGGVGYYVQSPAVSIFRGNTTIYYCTPLEAERAGLSANSHQYHFPHLEEYKRKNLGE